MLKWFVIRYDYGFYCGPNMVAWRRGCPFRIEWTCTINADSRQEAISKAKEAREW